MLHHRRAFICGAPVILMALFCIVLGGCSSQLSPAQSKLSLARHADLHDASFNVTYVADGAQRQGTGTLTLQPMREEFIVAATSNGHQTQLDIVTDDSEIFARVQGDTLWGQLNDTDDSPPINFDGNIINYNQLSQVVLESDTMLAGVHVWHLHATFSMGLYDPISDYVQLPGSEDLWIRQADGLPLREVKQVSGSTIGSDGTTYPLVYDATYDFTAWNTGVTISIPDPDQIAPSG